MSALDNIIIMVLGMFMGFIIGFIWGFFIKDVLNENKEEKR